MAYSAIEISHKSILLCLASKEVKKKINYSPDQEVMTRFWNNARFEFGRRSWSFCTSRYLVFVREDSKLVSKKTIVILNNDDILRLTRVVTSVLYFHDFIFDRNNYHSENGLLLWRTLYTIIYIYMYKQTQHRIFLLPSLSSSGGKKKTVHIGIRV